MKNKLELLETASSDIRNWAKPIVSLLNRDREVRQEVIKNPDLRRKIEGIISAAFHQNFEESDYHEDGIHLSYLRQYPQKVSDILIAGLKRRPDLYGYISKHISIFQI